MRRVRDLFVAEADPSLHHALAGQLAAVLGDLAPDRLGLYWPLRSEFNAAGVITGDRKVHSFDLALPYAQKSACEMHYRAWDGAAPTLRDECGIPSCEGARVVPDVVLVPCLGFTATGFRLGYGGGYYDRWLAAHPHVTAVGVAWSATQIDESELVPGAHDHPMMLVVTERGIVAD